MSENISVKILEAYIEVDKIQDSINNKIFQFVTQALELVNLSEDLFQIEKTIKLNKISLKDYILNSSCCTLLAENSISNYSLEELKQYLSHYQQQFGEDGFAYNLALALYELLESIEKLTDEKVALEISKLSELTPLINKIQNIDASEYEELYNQLKKELNNNYLNQNLIDNKSLEICIQFINDIFNYFISGYPDIPEENLFD